MFFNTLNNLNEGESARVSQLNSTGAIRRRLQELGIIQGTNIKCLQSDRSGKLKAFLIRGAAIALRCDDSACIDITIA